MLHTLQFYYSIDFLISVTNIKAVSRQQIRKYKNIKRDNTFLKSMILRIYYLRDLMNYLNSSNNLLLLN